MVNPGYKEKGILRKNISQPANSGKISLFTTTYNIIIKYIALISKIDQPSDFVSIGIYGGDDDSIVFISNNVGNKAALTKKYSQIVWKGSAYLEANQEISAFLSGEGTTTVNFDVIIEYEVI